MPVPSPAEHYLAACRMIEIARDWSDPEAGSNPDEVSNDAARLALAFAQAHAALATVERATHLLANHVERSG
jgi:hypothetical protein